jgi:tetratricopeptide (TPR) repeat protein
MMKDQAQKAAELPDAEVDASSDPADDHNKRGQPQARASEIENIFRRSCNYLDRNEFDSAARAFRSVLLMDPTHYKALTGLGRCLAEMGMREEARKCFEKALEIKPDYAQARVNLELQGS